METTTVEQLLTKDQLAELLQVHPNTIDRYRKTDPLFPRPLELPGRLLRWRQSAITSWMGTLGGA